MACLRKRNGQYRHGERTKGAKLSALLKGWSTRSCIRAPEQGASSITSLSD